MARSGLVALAALMALVAVVMASDPAKPLEPPHYDIVGTYYTGADCASGTASPFQALNIMSGVAFNFTNSTSGGPIEASVNCTTGGSIFTLYPTSSSAIVFQYGQSSRVCANAVNGTGSVLVGCGGHVEPTLISVPATWNQTVFNLTTTTVPAEAALCRFASKVSIAVIGTDPVQIQISGNVSTTSLCYETTNPDGTLVITSAPIALASLPTTYRFYASANGYVFTVNRVQYEGALEIFYDLPNSNPTGRFNCLEGNCLPYQFNGTAIVVATFGLVFGLPIVVIAFLGLQQRRSRVHDE